MDWHLIDPNHKSLSSIADKGINAARNRDPKVAPANNAIAPMGEKFGGYGRNRATTPTTIKAATRTIRGKFNLVAKLGEGRGLETFLALLLNMSIPFWNSTDQTMIQQAQTGTLDLCWF